MNIRCLDEMFVKMYCPWFSWYHNPTVVNNNDSLILTHIKLYAAHIPIGLNWFFTQADCLVFLLVSWTDAEIYNKFHKVFMIHII